MYSLKKILPREIHIKKEEWTQVQKKNLIDKAVITWLEKSLFAVPNGLTKFNLISNYEKATTQILGNDYNGCEHPSVKGWWGTWKWMDEAAGTCTHQEWIFSKRQTCNLIAHYTQNTYVLLQNKIWERLKFLPASWQKIPGLDEHTKH